MPDITITIPQPIITPPEKFKFRYRLLPGGVFTAYSDQDNDPFVLSGLAVGQYEYEALFVNADAIECGTVVGNFEVVAEAECLDFEVEQVVISGITYLQISYTIPSPFVNFTCGYNFYYRPTGSGQPFQNLSKPNLPASPLLIQVDPNTDYDVEIRGNSCAFTTLCFSDEIPAPDEPCTPRSLVSAALIDQGALPNGDRKIHINLTFTESTPATGGYVLWNLVWNQTGINAGTPPASGSQSYPAGQFPFFVAATPSGVGLNIVVRHKNTSFAYVTSPAGWITIQGNITDRCGVSHYWTAQLQIE